MQDGDGYMKAELPGEFQQFSAVRPHFPWAVIIRTSDEGSLCSLLSVVLLFLQQHKDSDRTVGRVGSGGVKMAHVLALYMHLYVHLSRDRQCNNLFLLFLAPARLSLTLCV